MSRAALRWSRERLGRAANLSAETIRIYERGDGPPGPAGPSLHVNHIAAIMAALRAAGIEFAVDAATERTSIYFAPIQQKPKHPAKSPRHF